MKTHTKLISWPMRNSRVVVTIVLIPILVGIYALFTMPRQEFPDFTIRQGLVIGVYPGATSEEIENQLTKPIEKYLFGFDEINKKKTYSISKNGMMIVFVELNENITNADEFWSKLNHGLNVQKQSLPPGVAALIADNDFGNTSALLITLEADNLSYREMEPYLTKLSDELRKIDATSKVKQYGLQKEQITVYIDKTKLTSFNVKPAMLLAALSSEGLVIPSGILEEGQSVAPIHLPPRFNSEEDVAQQIIYSDPSGTVVRLQDIARIVREYPEPESYIKNNGKNCLMLSIEMKSGYNIVQFGKEVNKAIEKVKTRMPSNMHITRIADMPKAVDKSITDFLREFFSAIIGVILVIMVLLPFRVATIASVSIPISIFITICCINMMGTGLNTVSLAALMAVLGMVVDNAIVVIDNHVEKLDKGRSVWGAAVHSAGELFVPVLSATAAIAVTFIPVNFIMRGQMKEMTGCFTPAIFIALGVSLVITMTVIPLLNFMFIKTGLHRKNVPYTKKTRLSLIDRLQNYYDKSLEHVFRYPVVYLSIGVLIVIVGSILLINLPKRIFPKVERDQFAVEIYLPQGKSIYASSEIVDSMENILMKDPRVTNVTSCVGSGSPRFYTVYAPQMPSVNYAQLIVNTVSNEATVELIRECDSLNIDRFPSAHIRAKQLDMIAAQAPIEVRISGDSLSELKSVAESVASILRKCPEVIWVRNNAEQSSPLINLDVDRDEANRLGFNKTAISSGILARTSGLPLTTIWEGDYPVKVVLKTEEKDRNNADALSDLYLTSGLTQATVQLHQIAKVQPGWTESQIMHRNGIRTITVLADVKQNTNVSKIFPGMEKQIKAIPLPGDVSISYGGEYEVDWDTYPNLLLSIGIGVILIFMVLMLQFKKFNLALLIMITLALSLPGAAFGLKVCGFGIGGISLLGVISLFGMVTRNGIIYVDYAEKIRKKSALSLRESAINAGKRRMRPIFLTAAAASVGVIPMTLSNSPLWSPFGAIICFGTLVSMLLTIYIVPVAYWYAVGGHRQKPHSIVK